MKLKKLYFLLIKNIFEIIFMMFLIEKTQFL